MHNDGCFVEHDGGASCGECDDGVHPSLLVIYPV
jgi:hypothetical protein